MYHLDIKLDNILIDQNMQLKLADFGLSIQTTFETLRDLKIGTDMYMAPEIHNYEFNPSKADVFSLGVVLFCMMAKHSPWNSTNPENKEIGMVYLINNQMDEFWKYQKLSHLSDNLKTLL